MKSLLFPKESRWHFTCFIHVYPHPDCPNDQQPGRRRKRKSMSAARDDNQSSTFIYTNFYHLYLKSKAGSQSQNESGLAKGMVLKTRSITETPSVAEVRVISPEQLEQLQHWTHSSLNSNYRALRDSRKKLKYLMGEIEEILKRD
jgi:hypothetical protein